MTPALLRYKQLKSENPSAILLYRMGDFYECFYEDAITISKVLDITLTSRDKGPNKTPMAGIPYHALDAYLYKLIDAGFKVAVAEQEEEKVKDEKNGKLKTVIHRNISKIVTPSTFERETDSNAHFLVSIITNNPRYFLKADHEFNETLDKEINITIGCIDPNGANFWVTNFKNIIELDNELFRLNPAEILISKDLYSNILNSKFVSKFPQTITPIENNFFRNNENLLNHFKVKNLKSYGLDSELEIAAASACFNYLHETQHSTLSHISTLYSKSLSKRMNIDSNTLRNLEIIFASNAGGKSLLDILDKTSTRGGKRLLKDWITLPLCNVNDIENRLSSLKFFFVKNNKALLESLNEIYDLERVCARIGYGTASPRDFLSLSKSLIKADSLVDLIGINIDDSNNTPINLQKISSTITSTSENLKKLVSLINLTINEQAPANLKDGQVIRENNSKELDELRKITTNNKKWLRNLEILEQQKTGINTLRVKYNRVFGYFIEVPKSQIMKVPPAYIRKQTTVNGERYITVELKEKESMILGANDRIIELECELYTEFLNTSKIYLKDILELQNVISELDVYVSLATASQLNNYCEPIFKKDEIHIIDARHPVVEQLIKEVYVYNDINIRDGEMILITGPNMGGKSTYIRMTALITYMAHIGCFVPARECQMSLVDSIFTRVGASDDMSRGESTFMVEMTEAANILRNATNKSLIILDEIGRGTSTYDGLSIAWAIVYYIHEKVKAKTLFATHYHELTVLEEDLKRMSNYTVAISEEDGNVIFLRKIERGKAEKSFGIHVAKLAGLPQEVLDKASEILGDLEKKALKQSDRQMGLWEFNIGLKTPSKHEKSNEKIIEKIKNLDLNNLTPIQALQEIAKIKEEIC